MGLPCVGTLPTLFGASSRRLWLDGSTHSSARPMLSGKASGLRESIPLSLRSQDWGALDPVESFDDEAALTSPDYPSWAD